MTEMRTLNIPGYERVLRCKDRRSGLDAVIAIHDTTLGPAAGGCRMWRYASEREAVTDALRLARGMTFKAAAADLPVGGGKTVVIGDSRRGKSPALFHALGRVVESLGGAYWTGEDVGTPPEDMAEIGRETRYVAGLADTTGDPSPVTAAGVLHGIRAAARQRFGSAALDGLTVAVQGLGHVGYALCELLRAEGARLVVADIAPEAVARAVSELGAKAADPGGIVGAAADIFAPCALGGVIDDDAVGRLRAAAVAGAANNQLAEPAHGAALHRRGILYAPDYVINAGGLIAISWDVLRPGERRERAAALAEAGRIGARLAEIFARSARRNRPPEEIAEALARERLAPPAAA